MHTFMPHSTFSTMLERDWSGFDIISQILKLLWLLWAIPAALRRLIAQWLAACCAKATRAPQRANKDVVPTLPPYDSAGRSEFNAWHSDAGLY